MMFGRKIVLLVGDGENAPRIPIDDSAENRLRISFKIIIGQDGDASEARVDLWNIKKTSRRFFERKEGRKIRIFAGYGDADLFSRNPVFEGSIFSAQYYDVKKKRFSFANSVREGRVDIVTSFFLTNRYRIEKPQSSEEYSFSEGGSLRESIKAVIGDSVDDVEWGHLVGEESKVIGTWEPSPDPLEAIRSQVAKHGLVPRIEGDTLKFREKGAHQSAMAGFRRFSINKDTGMISIPNFVDTHENDANLSLTAVKVKSLFRPEINRIGDVCRLDSDYGGYDGIHGEFLIVEIEHQCDNVEGEFSTTLLLQEISKTDQGAEDVSSN